MRWWDRFTPGFKATIAAIAVILLTSLVLEVARADTALVCDQNVTVYLTHPIEPAKLCVEETCLDMEWTKSVFTPTEATHEYYLHPFIFKYRMERGDTKKATFFISESGFGMLKRPVRGSCVLENYLGS